jgi:AraC-like DNA-binding protein
MIDDPSILRFSTADVPAHERVPVLREWFGRTMVRLEIEQERDAPVHYELVARALPGLTVSRFFGSRVHARRTRELMADGNDDLALCLSSEAGYFVSHVGRELRSGSDEAVLLSLADPYTIATPPPMSSCVIIHVPRRTLARSVPRLEDNLGRAMPMRGEALRLLTRYIGILDEHQPLETPELSSAVVSHVHDLVALALGASRDAGEIARGRGLRAARLHSLKADILENLNAQNFGLAAVAGCHGVTPRYVQKLFESEGLTFSQFLLEQRLTRAYRMLGDPRFFARRISDIAFEAGFGDLPISIALSAAAMARARLTYAPQRARSDEMRTQDDRVRDLI